MSSRSDTRHRGWIVLSVVVALYGIMGVLKKEVAIDALFHTLELLYGLFPILGIVFVIMFFFNLCAEPQWWLRWVGGQSGPKGWGMALIAGILSVGPVYVWYPLLGELRQQGMRPALLGVFLYSRAIKLPLLPLMVHYFGGLYTITLVLYMIVFSLLSGVIIDKLAAT